MPATLPDELEDLLADYWDCAYQEGQSGQSNGDKANDILHRIREAFHATTQEAFGGQEVVALAAAVRDAVCELAGDRAFPDLIAAIDQLASQAASQPAPVRQEPTV